MYIIRGSGLGSWFGYGRSFGLHRPWDSPLNKAADPFINNRTLLCLAKKGVRDADLDLMAACSKNLASHLMNGQITPEKAEKFPKVIMDNFLKTLREQVGRPCLDSGSALAFLRLFPISTKDFYRALFFKSAESGARTWNLLSILDYFDGEYMPKINFMTEIPDSPLVTVTGQPGCSSPVTYKHTGFIGEELKVDEDQSRLVSVDPGKNCRRTDLPEQAKTLWQKTCRLWRFLLRGNPTEWWYADFKTKPGQSEITAIGPSGKAEVISRPGQIETTDPARKLNELKLAGAGIDQADVDEYHRCVNFDPAQAPEFVRELFERRGRKVIGDLQVFAVMASAKPVPLGRGIFDPCLIVHGHLPSHETFYIETGFKPENFDAARSGHCRVSLDPNNSLEYIEDPAGDYYLMKIEGQSRANQPVKITLKLKPQACGWLPGQEEVFHKGDRYAAYYCAVPRSEGEVEVKVGNWTYRARGISFTDHNWSNIGLDRFANGWYMGKLHSGPYTIYFADVHPRPWYRRPETGTMVILMISQGDRPIYSLSTNHKLEVTVFQAVGRQYPQKIRLNSTAASPDFIELEIRFKEKIMRKKFLEDLPSRALRWFIRLLTDPTYFLLAVDWDLTFYHRQDQPADGLTAQTPLKLSGRDLYEYLNQNLRGQWLESLARRIFDFFAGMI